MYFQYQFVSDAVNGQEVIEEIENAVERSLRRLNIRSSATDD
ncbi:hypothetical protein PAECIP112173_00093 [Paenibacillus sp. JJ-100]|nr:hypothetical protein PAECIP112173_00093 [Paenibacillus sp. JJ-100]